MIELEATELYEICLKVDKSKIDIDKKLVSNCRISIVNLYQYVYVHSQCLIVCFTILLSAYGMPSNSGGKKAHRQRQGRQRR